MEVMQIYNIIERITIKSRGFHNSSSPAITRNLSIGHHSWGSGVNHLLYLTPRRMFGSYVHLRTVEPIQVPVF
jgi:hypothetical protein